LPFQHLWYTFSEVGKIKFLGSPPVGFYTHLSSPLRVPLEQKPKQKLLEKMRSAGALNDSNRPCRNMASSAHAG